MKEKCWSFYRSVNDFVLFHVIRISENNGETRNVRCYNMEWLMEEREKKRQKEVHIHRAERKVATRKELAPVECHLLGLVFHPSVCIYPSFADWGEYLDTRKVQVRSLPFGVSPLQL